jgi:hypothetical protein
MRVGGTYRYLTVALLFVAANAFADKANGSMNGTQPEISFSQAKLGHP